MVGGEFHLLFVPALSVNRAIRLNGGYFNCPRSLFPARKSREVMAARELNCRMKWGESLNEHFTFDIATTGASGHLGQS